MQMRNFFLSFRACEETITRNKLSKKYNLLFEMKTQEFIIKGEDIKQLISKDAGFCFISNKVVKEGFRLDFLYKEQGEQNFDSGWRFFAGDESDEYINNPENCSLVLLNTAINYAPELIPYLDSSIGTQLERVGSSNKFKIVD